MNDTIQMILKYHQSLKKTLRVFTRCLQFIGATNKNSSIIKSLHDLEETYSCQHCTCEHCSSMNDIHVSNEFSSITLKETNKHKYELKKDYQVPIVNVRQYQSSLLFLIRSEQKYLFEHDYKNLERNLNLNKKSKILTLRPFLDNHQLIRIKGRILDQAKKDSTRAQHYQILLHHENLMTRMIILNYHLENFCMGIRTVFYHTQKMFYQLKGWKTIQKVIRSCVICKIRNCQMKNRIV